MGSLLWGWGTNDQYQIRPFVRVQADFHAVLAVDVVGESRSITQSRLDDDVVPIFDETQGDLGSHCYAAFTHRFLGNRYSHEDSVWVDQRHFANLGP